MYFTASWGPMHEILAGLAVLQAPQNLERLVLHRTRRRGRVNSLTDPITLFRGMRMTSLKYVDMKGVHINWSMTSLRNLRELTLEHLAKDVAPSSKELMRILERSPDLKTLCLSDVCSRLFDGDLTSFPNRVRLTDLRNLTIDSLRPLQAYFIISILSAPNLRRLNLLHLVKGDYTDHIGTLVGKFPQVTVLNIHGLYTSTIGSVPFYPWLCSMQNLKYLSACNIAPLFFSYLGLYMPRGDRSEGLPIFPLLESIDASAIPYDTVAFLAGQRQAMGVALRRIFLRHSSFEHVPFNRDQLCWIKNRGILSWVPQLYHPELHERYER